MPILHALCLTTHQQNREQGNVLKAMYVYQAGQLLPFWDCMGRPRLLGRNFSAATSRPHQATHGELARGGGIALSD